MTAGKTQPGQRKGFADLAPAWISAIAALIASLVAAGAFLVGRGTAPPTGAPPTPPPAPSSSAAAPIEDATRSTAPQRPGAAVARYQADVAEGYGIDIATETQLPRARIPGDASLVVPAVSFVSTGDGGELAPLDESDAANFEVCAANTKFTRSLNFLGRGDSFCYSGRGLLADITVKTK